MKNMINSISDKRRKRKCKHFDKGLCYRREHCNFLHPIEVCKEIMCINKEDCPKRHPKTCFFYYFLEKKCRFKETCLFKHVESINANEHEQLKMDNVNFQYEIVELKSQLKLYIHYIVQLKLYIHYIVR